MSDRHTTKLVHEGAYVADVDVTVFGSDTEGWAPYLSLEDAQKLDKIRVLLRDGDLKTASQLARVYRLMPVTV